VHLLVYLPLLVPLVGAGAAGRLAERLEPRLATWLLTVSAVLLATASGVALTALAATAIGQIHLVAALGHWSGRILRRDDPAALWIARVACVLLVAAVGGSVVTMVRRGRAVRDAARTARSLPGRRRLSVLADPAPQAYALPGRPGRVVVSTGMLRALDRDERRVLLAHERAHLDCRHHRFVLVAQCAAAANPVLRPVATAVAYTVERWADEHAARATADRRLVARTISKAALLTVRHRRVPGVVLAIAADRLGPVPRRVAALLAEPPRRRTLLLSATVAVLVVATLSTVVVCRDLDSLFDLARVAHRWQARPAAA
jgi:Zn-dependent protease with chaperone function